ncbi:hypothetical protein [Ehrlichia canis]|uniref:hypothetical protein n=1 Tax=Ehrlichia canis TaxID=944 RepID=UPI001E644A7E|nr:hypothetical protein [Ehrlichia canis]
MSYFHYILFYITDNPKWYILLAVILLIGTGYFLRQKAAKKSKKDSSIASYYANNMNGSSPAKPHNKNYIPELNTAQNKQQSSFIVESVSQVFESKTQGRSR